MRGLFCAGLYVPTTTAAVWHFHFVCHYMVNKLSSRGAPTTLNKVSAVSAQRPIHSNTAGWYPPPPPLQFASFAEYPQMVAWVQLFLFDVSWC